MRAGPAGIASQVCALATFETLASDIAMMLAAQYVMRPHQSLRLARVGRIGGEAVIRRCVPF